MATRKKKTDEVSVDVNVQPIKRGRIVLALLGNTPLILNRQNEKTKRTLLLPPPKKSQGQKATTLKHEPFVEFSDAPHTSRDPDSPTLLQLPSVCFKNALRSVAIDLPEATSKAALGRLTYVENDYVPIYGIPKVHMTMVRQAGINRTPDVRTRCIVPQWCALVPIVYTMPLITQESIINLMDAAGMINGVGDWRAQKGGGNYGCWTVSDPRSKEFKAVMKHGRVAQLKAMDAPECYDSETEDLLTWYVGEVMTRGFAMNLPANWLHLAGSGPVAEGEAA